MHHTMHFIAFHEFLVALILSQGDPCHLSTKIHSHQKLRNRRENSSFFMGLDTFK